jgi:signal peptidase I
MVKRKPVEAKIRRSSSQPVRSEAASAPPESAWFSPSAVRETIESVIIAFVLAFLFRTFEAEAFVIPTGSMAPTLMGKHKDIECPMCHYRYQVSASDRQNSDVASTVYHATCPMCRFTADLFPQDPSKYPSYDGDRILVAKFPYELADPKRWDVIVFKFPGDSTMNYIKRLVGLPGETILIHHGDLWIHQPGQPEGQFAIARKPPEKLLAMLQPVFDNDLAPTISGVMRWPMRWTPEPATAGSAWTNVKDASGKEDLAAFEIDGKVAGPAWIRYRHRVPAADMWWQVETSVGKQSGDMTRDDCKKVLGENEAFRQSVPAQLISDFTAYNTGDSDVSRPDRAHQLRMDRDTQEKQEKLIEQGYGLHWVGDLALQFELDAKSASGNVVAELVKGGCRFQCRFDLASGKAGLAILRDGLAPDPQADQSAQRFHATSTKPVAGAGSHKFLFSNVDDELRLWVVDSWGHFSPVEFDAPTTYDSEQLKDHIPTRSDLAPVGIAAEGAAAKVSHIMILRDIYYIAVFNEGRKNDQSPLKDYKTYDPDLTVPEKWPEVFNSENMRTVEIKLNPPNTREPEKDRFFVLGDNSAQSSDGRLWTGEWTVERELLIGKALFIYWPHGWKIPYVPLYFNVVPYFQRMHLVR